MALKAQENKGVELPYGSEKDTPIGERIASQQKLELWKNGILEFFRKVNSTVANREVPVVWVDPRSANAESVAFTDGETVFLNPIKFRTGIAAKLNKGSSALEVVQAISELKGASYHELAHILYTPRRNSEPTKSLIKLADIAKPVFYTLYVNQYDNLTGEKFMDYDSFVRNHALTIQPDCKLITHVGKKPIVIDSVKHLLRSYNILEDLRIESRFVANYKGATGYFVATAARFILDEQSNMRNVQRSEVFTGSPYEDLSPILVFLLTYGRRFLDKGLRNEAENYVNDFLNNHLHVDYPQTRFVTTKLIKEVIDEYRLLVLPKDSVRAFELIILFNSIYNALNSSLTEKQKDTIDDIKSHENQTRGRVEKVSSQEADTWKIEEEDEADDSDSSDEGAGSSDSDSDDEADDDSADSSDSNGSDSSDDGADDDSADSDSDSDSSDDSDSGKTEGGNGSSKLDAVNTMTKQWSKLRKEQERGHKEVEQDAFAAVKTIANKIMQARRASKPVRKDFTSTELKASMRLSSKLIQDAFNTLKADGEEIWELGQPSGKFNAGAAMNSRNTHKNVFSQWVDAGDEASSFEIVLLVDQSSSMSGYKQDAVSKGVWIICNACDKLEIPITVIGYDTSARLLYNSEHPVPLNTYDRINATGSTDPDDAIAWAENIFHTSEAHNKLLFSLTDGEWGGNLSSGYIEACNKLGVHTTLFLQGEPNFTWNSVTKMYETEKDANGRDAFFWSGFHYIGSDSPTKNNMPTYNHHQVYKIGDAEKELPKIMAKAVLAIAGDIAKSA